MKIFNTLTKRKEEFVPLEEGKVKMYVCGPTVYNYIHIGNARPILMVSTVASFFPELQAHMETIMSTARTSANTFFILFLHIF